MYAFLRFQCFLKMKMRFIKLNEKNAYILVIKFSMAMQDMISAELSKKLLQNMISAMDWNRFSEILIFQFF